VYPVKAMNFREYVQKRVSARSNPKVMEKCQSISWLL
jgi:hypothetical protein